MTITFCFAEVTKLPFVCTKRLVHTVRRYIVFWNPYAKKETDKWRQTHSDYYEFRVSNIPYFLNLSRAT